MAYVVKNQAEKFRTDPLMIELSAPEPTPICFAGCPHAKEAERQQTFMHGCVVIKRLPIVIPGNGLNFDLTLKNVKVLENDVEFESDLILNGICVRWKAQINKFTLNGFGRLELDIERAEIEQQRAQIIENSFEKRISDLKDVILKQ